MRLVAEIEIAGLPEMTNKQRRGWKAKWANATKWKKLVYGQCYQQNLVGLRLEKATLTLTRCSCREPDFDGLVSGFKCIIDGLTEAGVIIDDKRAVIGQPSYNWLLTKPKASRIIVRIETTET